MKQISVGNVPIVKWCAVLPTNAFLRMTMRNKLIMLLCKAVAKIVRCGRRDLGALQGSRGV